MMQQTDIILWDPYPTSQLIRACSYSWPIEIMCQLFFTIYARKPMILIRQESGSLTKVAQHALLAPT
jgi:hypothetical protein